MSGRRTPRRSTRSPQPASASKSAAVSLGAAARAIAAEAARPALPSRANELLPVHKGRLHSVKTQELKLDKLSILIARVKAPVPKGVSGHLIKRFDTDAVSASSFFRVAFPASTVQEEEDEMSFLRSRYDTATAGAEHQGPEGRLTGTWVATPHATELAEQYGIAKFAADLIAFENPFAPPNQDIPEPEAEPVEAPGVLTRAAKKAASPTPSETARSTKRARVTSPRLAPNGSMAPSPSLLSLAPHARSASAEVDTSAMTVTVSSLSQDPKTGAPVEEVTSASLIGTDAQVAQARAEARDLLASLQQAGAATSTASADKKRTLASDAEETENAGFLNRIWQRRRAAKQLPPVAPAPAPTNRAVATRPRSDRVTPATRRNLAVVGLMVAGAAATIAPYFF